MSYTRVNWQNSPNTSTPLSAENLNKMDAGIKQNADDIETLQQHTYDAELNSTSTNAPQTKAVKEAIDNAIEKATVLIDPTLSNEGQAADAKATGDAVADVKSQINYCEKNIGDIDLLKITTPFVAGRALNSSGAIFDNGSALKRIATVEFIDISSVKQIHYTVVNGYRVYIAYYSMPTESAYLANSGWLTGTATINKTSTYNYMRLCYASVSDASTLTLDDINKASITVDYPLYYAVKESLCFKGYISTIKSGALYTDVNAVRDYGMYAVYDDALNIPVSVDGTLLVMPIGWDDFSTGLYRLRKQQVFIACNATGEKNIFMRYMQNSTTWSPNWTRVIDYTIYDKLSAINAKSLTASGFTASNFESGGISESGANTSNSNRIRTAGYVDVQGYDSIQYSITDGYRMNVVFFSTNASDNDIFYSTWLMGDGVLIFPEGTKYYKASYASIGDSTALTTDDYNKVTIKYGTALTDTANPIVEQTKWLALGDSITYGIYSTGTSTEVTNTYGWVQRLAASLGYKLKTMASRGMGYTVDGVDPLDPSAPRIMLSDLLTRAVALTDDFNLITLAFGINDYNTNGTTLAGISTALSNAIQTLMTAFPSARLVVITPFNCTKEGSVATKYAYGATHAANTYTLGDLAEAIDNVCDTYGVECINASDRFLLNTVNITTLLPDGVHPSYACHNLIAKNMAHFLLN